MISPLIEDLANTVGRVAGAYVRGLPKGGDWTVFDLGYHGPASLPGGVIGQKMRLQFKGRYTFEAFIDALETIFAELQQNDMNGLAYVNLYFHPQHDGTTLVLHNNDGTEIKHLVMENSSRLERKAFVATTDGLSQVVESSLL